MDARLEVAVAREHGGAHEIVLGDHLLDGGFQRPGVADAGGAAVGGEVEAELLEVRRQPRPLQVFGHHPGARRERGFHVRLDREAALDRLLGEQPRAEQDAWVRGVGAGSDRGDHHVTRTDFDAIAGPDAFLEVLGLLREAVLGGGFRE